MGFVNGTHIGHAVFVRLMVGGEGDVATVQYGGYEAEDGRYGFGIEANGYLDVLWVSFFVES